MPAAVQRGAVLLEQDTAILFQFAFVASQLSSLLITHHPSVSHSVQLVKFCMLSWLVQLLPPPLLLLLCSVADKCGGHTGNCHTMTVTCCAM
jgi:hypothetical protein